MENSLKIESMPTLSICHYTGRNHHFKMESQANYKAASPVAHRRDISFWGFLIYISETQSLTITLESQIKSTHRNTGRIMITP